MEKFFKIAHRPQKNEIENCVWDFTNPWKTPMKCLSSLKFSSKNPFI